MTRLQKFESLRDHYWLKKSFKKLSKEEILLTREFIQDREHLNEEGFELAVNRMFLDQSVKPKNWIVISELLSNCNS